MNEASAGGPQKKESWGLSPLVLLLELVLVGLAIYGGIQLYDNYSENQRKALLYQEYVEGRSSGGGATAWRCEDPTTGEDEKGPFFAAFGRKHYMRDPRPKPNSRLCYDGKGPNWEEYVPR